MASVSKRRWKKPDGSTAEAWAVRYRDPHTGRRPCKTFELKKDADAFRRKVEREIEDGSHTADFDAATVRKVGDAFVDDAEERHRAGTIGRSRLDRFRTVNRRYVASFFGDKRFRDVTLADVESFYTDMTRRHGLAPITARENVVVLRMMERYARRRGHMKAQPVTDALAEIRASGRKRVRTFTADEMAKVLATAAARAPGCKPRPAAMMECMVNVAAFCGLRMGEILGLTIENVDLERRVLRVRHSLTQYGLLKGPKTSAGVRDVPLPRHVEALLTSWLSRFYVANDRRLVFRTATGGALSAQNYRVTWHALLKRAGVHVADDPHHFHALRHFTASWMIENGLPLTTVAALLGHSAFDVTLQVYAHPVVAPHMQHEAIERMVASMPTLADASAKRP
jgi:integrase